MKKLAVILFLVIALVALNSPVSVLAHDPGIWIKTDGVNEITPALTKGTATFEDDEGSEFVHQIQQWGAFGSQTFTTAQEALNWVHGNITYVTDQIHYGVPEAWANPEQTLNQASGDSEDLAFLLASLLKWYTDEVNIGEGDLVYAVCGFLPPPVDGFHAWVFWYDASEMAWHQLDPTSGEMNDILYPALGTLWLNDEHLWGFLPEYYPGPLPPVAGYDRDDFSRIAEGGFGDPMNNYAWSMAYFNGDLYVGTGRNIPWRLLQAILGPDYEFQHITYPRGDIGSQQWAEDMRAEIWRHDSWERVYQSPVESGPPFAPRESGFRHMVVFDGEIYAASGGGFSAGGLLLKSIDGTTWEQVATPPEMGTDSREMLVHNGKLYVGTGYEGRAEVWAFPSNPDAWEKVADFSSVDPANLSVTSLESFNGHLYAGTMNILSGYQVFRSDAQLPNHPQLGQWTRIVEYGGGDMANYMAGTMEVFNNQLYLGSMSLPLRVGNPIEFGPPKGFELIRINTDDSWELVVGDYIPWIPPAGPTFRFPESGWPGGFGNFFNFYCWSLEVDDGVLYLGTFDASSFLRFLPVEDLAELIELTPEQQEQIVIALQQVIGLLEELGIDEDYIELFRRLLEAFESTPIDWEAVWQVLTDDRFAGGDLWKTEDGVWWEPVTLNGFDEPDNYGLRNILHINPLFIGTANPFNGLEIWAAPRGTIIVEKQTNPAGGTDFDFTDNIAARNSFTLDHGDTQTFNNVVPGQYIVTEDDPTPAFDLTGLICVEDVTNNSTTDLANRQAAIKLEPGETVTCTFTNTLQQFTLTVNKAGTGTGTVTSNPAGINCGADCTEVYDWDTLVTLTATPEAGSVFTGWSGDCSGTDPTTTVAMRADRTCTATFMREFTLTVNRAGSGTGTVTSEPRGINCGADCAEAYAEGTVVPLRATPCSRCVFVGWSGDCAGTELTTTVMMDADKACTATFDYVPKAVGGYGVPLSRLELLAPWFGILGLVALLGIADLVFRRRSA